MKYETKPASVGLTDPIPVSGRNSETLLFDGLAGFPREGEKYFSHSLCPVGRHVAPIFPNRWNGVEFSPFSCDNGGAWLVPVLPFSFLFP